MHPVTPRLALATVTHSRFDAVGIARDDSSGSRDGHLVPFAWSG